MRSYSILLAIALSLPVSALSQQVQFKNPAELSRPNGYTHVVIVNQGKLIFISGQVDIDKDGKISGDFAEQARQVFANLQAALSAAEPSRATWSS